MSCVLMACGVLLALSGSAPALTNSLSTMTSAGEWTSGGGCQNLAAVAQGSPVGRSSGGGFINHSGFLQSFVMFPSLDSDGDGTPDENDLDDDGDGISDVDEMSGQTFVPATVTDIKRADSDGDGASDLDESRGGTNPQDSTNAFQIESIRMESGKMVVSWVGRSDGASEYEVVQGDSLEDLMNHPSVVETSVLQSVGGPWPLSRACTTNAPVPGGGFLGVRRVK